MLVSSALALLLHMYCGLNVEAARRLHNAREATQQKDMNLSSMNLASHLPRQDSLYENRSAQYSSEDSDEGVEVFNVEESADLDEDDDAMTWYVSTFAELKTALETKPPVANNNGASLQRKKIYLMDDIAFSSTSLKVTGNVTISGYMNSVNNVYACKTHSGSGRRCKLTGPACNPGAQMQLDLNEALPMFTMLERGLADVNATIIPHSLTVEGLSITCAWGSEGGVLQVRRTIS